MNKKKDAPALLELIHRGKGKAGIRLDVPDWMTGGKKPAKAPEVQPAPPAVEEAPPPSPPPPPPPPPVPRPAVRAPRPVRMGERLLAADGGRLRLSVSPAQAVVAGVAAVLLIVVVFVLGLVARGSSSSPASQAAGRQNGRDASLRAGAGGERREMPTVKAAEPLPAPTAARRGEAVLVKGKYYLVVQGLMGTTEQHRAEAEAIAAFLNGRGEPVVVTMYPGPPRQYIVVSLRGFDQPDGTRAKEYMRAIEEQGKLYRSQGGRYDFRQGEGGWFVTP